MANLCSFLMQINGKEEDIEKFIKVLSQDGPICMGRGASFSVDMKDNHRMIIGGTCKWSITSALIGNAEMMQYQKETGEGAWEEAFIKEKEEFITLYEACKRFGVNVEVFSEEPGNCFSEHIVFENNGRHVHETVPYYERYNSETDEWEAEGGFGEWAFDLAEVI